MTELLANIIVAHGGLERWKNFSRVEATIVTNGALWGMKNLTAGSGAAPHDRLAPRGALLSCSVR